MEKLNLWDRFFNRYKQEIVKQGVETWTKRKSYDWSQTWDYERHFVIYKIIDRVTGSETIEKDYLN